VSRALRALSGALLFTGIGVAVALGVALPQQASATHNPVISWLQQGLIIDVTCSPFKDDPDYGQYWIPNSHPCWHDDEPGTRTAMDYPAVGGQSTVYLYYFGDFQHMKIVNLPYTTNCTGVAARAVRRLRGQ